MMTIPLTIAKSKTTYLSFSLLAILAIAFYAAQRGVESDVKVYYDFYRDLMEDGITGVLSCQSFEPLFCVGSLAFAELTGSEGSVHFIWACLFYIITLRAFLMFWPLFVSERKYSIISCIVFLFISINYIDPQAVYFLTRQYVASSLIILGIAYCLNNKNPIFIFAFASLIHFGALPIVILVYLATRKFDFRFVVGVILFGTVVAYLSRYSLFQLYIASVQYKLAEYQGLNDGDVTIVQEIKVFVYWATAAYMFKMAKPSLSLSYILIYIFYLLTFQNDLFHLRYYKYLEAMSWPSAFLLFYLMKSASGHIFISALSLRIYRYLTLLSPEAAVFYMLKISFLSFLSLFI